MTTLAATSAPDWRAAAADTVRHLQHLIRAVTVNPPGNEIVAGRYLDGVLRAAGIETTLLEPAPTRAAVVARLRGSGARRPVLLLAHMDVVGVEPEGWSVDPFAGVVRDGYVYGRGAIDDKGMLAANLETMLLLKRHVVDAGGTLARDVVFVATADEEAGGDWGIEWLIRHHPALLDAEFALNEGGRIRVVGGRPLYAAVQCAEKVSHVVRMTAHGPPGHAAVPLAGNAVVRLGRALAAVGEHREPVRLTPTTRAFFAELARVWPEPRQAEAMADVGSGEPGRVERGARVLSPVPVFDAVLRNGVSPVVVSGGIRHNVIPADASATLNIRTLPGERVEDVVARLAAAVDDPAVEFEVAGAPPADPPASPFDSAMFAALGGTLRELDPAIAVVPYLSTGATDSARLRAAGVQAYGVLPFPLEQGDEERMHGHDERVPLESLYFGVRLVYGAIRRVAT